MDTTISVRSWENATRTGQAQSEKSFFAKCSLECIGFIILPVSICLQIILESLCLGLRESRAVSHSTSWHRQNLSMLKSYTQEMSPVPQPSSPAAGQTLGVLAGSVEGHEGQSHLGRAGGASQAPSPVQGGSTSIPSPCLTFLGNEHVLLHAQEELVWLQGKLQREHCWLPSWAAGSVSLELFGGAAMMSSVPALPHPWDPAVTCLGTAESVAGALLAHFAGWLKILLK